MTYHDPLAPRDPGDFTVATKPRSLRSVTCLCSVCRREWVRQKEGERALCTWCKYAPPKEAEQRVTELTAELAASRERFRLATDTAVALGNLALGALEVAWDINPTTEDSNAQAAEDSNAQ